MLKLHRQFGHPSVDKLANLLRDADVWEPNFEDILTQIKNDCQTCKIYRRTPSRPVVGMPMASKFNETVALDLKKWKDRHILHMIDMWSRLTISVFIKDKRPKTIVDCILQHWIGAGYGLMGSILTDNGGEFTSEETREVTSILGIQVATTGADSPFQNGLCERGHAITDSMLQKMKADLPDVRDDILLMWAVNAKNCLQMWQGYSSYQLVYGENPHLPNIMVDPLPAMEGSTTSETLAKHLNALHASRKAFIEAESCGRIRTALRNRIRTGLFDLQRGEKVYYKRESVDRWLGPASVLFQDGKVIFIRHGSSLVRVSPSRVCRMNEQSQVTNPTPDKNSPIEKCTGEATGETAGEETIHSENHGKQTESELKDDRDEDPGQSEQLGDHTH